MNALSASDRLTRGWAWLYTFGLATSLRGERRSEIDSDLWEQRDAAQGHGIAGRRLALATLARCLLGIPADLSWRAEQSRATGLPGAALRSVVMLLRVAERLAGWIDRRGLPGLTLLLGGLYALLGLVVIVTIPINDGAEATAGQLFAFGLICEAAAATIIFGSRRIEARPLLGATLICIAAGFMDLVLIATVVAPLATLLVVSSALRRGFAGRRGRAPQGLSGVRAANRKLSSYYAGMLPRAFWIPPELIARAAAAIDDDAHGVRRAVLRGVQLGLLWAIVGRIWMRQISDEQIFSVGGTLFILIVVSGFGAAAGYAFAVRRPPGAGCAAGCTAFLRSFRSSGWARSSSSSSATPSTRCSGLARAGDGWCAGRCSRSAPPSPASGRWSSSPRTRTARAGRAPCSTSRSAICCSSRCASHSIPPARAPPATTQAWRSRSNPLTTASCHLCSGSRRRGAA